MIICQKFIHRADLRANRHATYVFGDNSQRQGLGGQAAEMRGEINAFGIPTKHAPGMSYADFFHDDEAGDILPLWEEAFDELKRRPLVIWPLDGIGTGRALLAVHAPTLADRLHALTNDLFAAHGRTKILGRPENKSHIWHLHWGGDP